jgi:hypothetical protein
MEFKYDDNSRDRADFINGFKASNGSECLLERHSVFKKTHEVKRSRSSIANKLCTVSLHTLNAITSGNIISYPITGLDRPRGFQEVEAPRF